MREIAIPGVDGPITARLFPGATDERLRELLTKLVEADIVQSIFVVDRDHVRRRRLPIADQPG